MLLINTQMMRNIAFAVNFIIISLIQCLTDGRTGPIYRFTTDIYSRTIIGNTVLSCETLLLFALFNFLLKFISISLVFDIIDSFLCLKGA